MNADVLVLQEVRLDVRSAVRLKLPGSTAFCSPRDSRGGGAAIFVRDSCTARCAPVDFLSSEIGLEVLAARMLHDGVECFIVSVYMRPPAQLGTSLGRLLNLVADSSCLFCGDFDLHHPMWQPWMETTPSTHAEQFLSEVSDHGFIFQNEPGAFTHAQGTHSSVFDLTFTVEMNLLNWHSPQCRVAVAIASFATQCFPRAQSLPHTWGTGSSFIIGRLLTGLAFRTT